jgi:hypothetical protein
VQGQELHAKSAEVVEAVLVAAETASEEVALKQRPPQAEPAEKRDTTAASAAKVQRIADVAKQAELLAKHLAMSPLPV